MSTPIPSNAYIGQARATTNVQGCISIYDQWAATYNDVVGDKAQEYVAPTLATQAAIEFSLSTGGPTNKVILDAGCGTGLVGQALAVSGVKAIDGLDLSAPMLDVARKTGVYRDLDQADMTQPIKKGHNVYDIVLCVGTLTQGHVGPEPALRELVRVAKTNGIVVATILQEVWISGGFKAEVQKLQAEGQATVVSDDPIDYFKGHGDKAVLLILQKTDRT